MFALTHEATEILSVKVKESLVRHLRRAGSQLAVTLYNAPKETFKINSGLGYLPFVVDVVWLKIIHIS